MSISTPRHLHDFSFSSSSALLPAVFIALLVHILLLVGVNFPQLPKISPRRTIEISFAPRSQAKPNQQPAKLINEQPVSMPTERPKDNSPTPAHPVQHMTKPAVASHTLKPEPHAVKSISTPPTNIQSTPPLPPPETVTAEKPKLSVDNLMQQIADIGVQERNRTIQQNSQTSKIKFVHTVTKHKFLAEQYVKDWEDKVERTGNLNYPEAARHQGETQMLTMDVGINADGSIYSLRIVKSSGNTALDEAAKRIVRMSAPFAELPAELQREVDVLVMTRVWKFSDETGMTAR